MENLQISMTVVWTALGLGLLAAEIWTGTFVLLFFGLGALFAALARVLGLDSLAWEIVIFAFSGLASLFLFRGRLMAALASGEGAEFQIDQNQVITLSAEVPANGEAPISYQGSMWTAINDGNFALPKGEKVVIYKIEGVRLFVKHAEKHSDKNTGSATGKGSEKIAR
jgi:membrane protein implicated in regulation of membrane protease activity